MNKNKWFLNGGRGSGRTFRLLWEEYENKIAELEKACEETQKLLDKQIEATYRLDKENAELKESFFVVRCVRSGCPYLHLETRNCLKVGGFFTAVSNKHCPMMQNLNSSIQLTKATEIIKKLYAVYYAPCVTESDLKYRDELFAEIKQFLSEVEK